MTTKFIGAKLFPDKYERDKIIWDFVKERNKTELLKEALYRMAVAGMDNSTSISGVNVQAHSAIPSTLDLDAIVDKVVEELKRRNLIALIAAIPESEQDEQSNQTIRSTQSMSVQSNKAQTASAHHDHGVHGDPYGNPANDTYDGYPNNDHTVSKSDFNEEPDDEDLSLESLEVTTTHKPSTINAQRMKRNFLNSLSNMGL